MTQTEVKLSSAARLKEMVTVLKRHGIIHGVSPAKLKFILEDLGPTYVKLGQIMSMRTDMLPKSYCNELAELRTDVKPMIYEEVLQVIASEYGFAPEEAFQEIDPVCIGSASIAQVHKAVLKNGKVVVLKVQRPGIYQTMERDIQLLKKAISLIKVLNINVGDIDFRMFIDEMWATAQQEMNFIAEANYIKEFTDLNTGVKYIAFPLIERQLCTPRVLVMEYIDGVQIDDLDKLHARGYDLNEIGIKLAENYVKQIVDDGLFHADPHPGNIFIRDGKIVWLDLGMVGKINNHDRLLLKKIILAIVQHDIEGLKEVFLLLDTIKGRVNHTRLYEDIESLLERYGDLDLSELHFGQIMEEVKEVLNFHQISLPTGFTILGRGVITIEGVLAVCCPKVNFIQIMANHVSGKFLSELDARQELVSAGLSLYGFTKNSLELPVQFANILKMAMRGQAKINIDLSSADEPVRQADMIMDKLVLSILSAAFLIGASLVCMTSITLRLFGIPVISLIGYLIALLMAGWLMAKIIPKRLKRK
ncbi:AarF/UbiB family protein [Dehalobacter sp. 14DCB1]|uniref:ABC1 kinase family protein n=1 Tax=Dehalobacter sp. 14DCB1 TaxID=2070227 RepID=UPI00104745D6|nr:AarF/UbiB family protein [Dehalobacter sp. 14DCB1]TCX51624.1 ABC transporter [Dehalobacter sp. 14DCB1]